MHTLALHDAAPRKGLAGHRVAGTASKDRVDGASDGFERAARFDIASELARPSNSREIRGLREKRDAVAPLLK